MKKFLLLFVALTCCFAMKAQSVTYEPIMSIPSPINSDAVYYLGYQDGQDFYLHTSGTTAGQMQLSKNPENPLEYHIELFTNATPNFVYARCGTNYLTITNDGVSAGGLSPFNSSPYTLVIQDGDISSAAASGYTVCHDGDIITTHTGTSEGNLRFFVKTDQANQYDFSATCTTGQTLYYRIIDAEKHWVSIVAPNNETWDYGWNGFIKPTGNITLPETVTHNDISYTVKEIGICAFSLCDGLTGSLSIPNSVTSIGEQAFNRCSGFTGSLTIPNSVTSIGIYAFSGCSGFTGSLTIPNSVTSIGDNAFFDCSGFTGSLTIGNSVTNIGEKAFESCSNFTGSLNIPNSVTSIGGRAFSGCSGFTGSLIIPNSVAIIGGYAFSDCKGFTGSLTIGSSVEGIGGYAFMGCSGFTNIKVKPATPPTLGDNAFLNMSNLQTITVPCGNYVYDDYDSAAGWHSFRDKLVGDFVYDLTVASANTDFGSASITQQPDCSKSAKVTATPNDGCKFVNWTENGEVVSTDNPYIFGMATDRNLVANFSKQYDFSAACTTGQTLYYKIIDAEKHWVSIVAPNNETWDYGWNGFIKPTGNITLPETVTHNDISYTVKEIGNYAFSLCNGLTGSLIIPNSVTSIGEDAFFECSGFTGSLTIPNSVTSIGGHAFYDCSGFTGSLIIGSSVESIGAFAFSNCSGFSKIILKPATPPTLDIDVFSNMSKLQTITVPCGKFDFYYNSGLRYYSFKDIMVEDFVYDLTVASANNGFGSANITQQPDCSTKAKVTATPNDGYKFVNWTENGVVVSTDNPYIFGMATDRNLVANFSKQYDFSAACTTGQTLYYKIIDAEKHWVSIVAPNNETWDYGWNGFIKPTGNITLPETVTHNDISYTVKEIGNYAFSLCNGLTGSLSIPNSVTSIGDGAFNSCSNFTGSLTIPNSVTSIGVGAFQGCSGFTGSLTIGSSVESIWGFAFNGCSGFTGSLIIGSSVTSIGDYAYMDCSGFSKIILKPATPPTLGNDVFSNMSKLQTITVPCYSYDKYIEIWGDSYAEKMVEGFVYDLTVASANSGFGSANITLQPDCSTPAKVTATPNDGYKFVNWTENGVVVSTENPYTFEMTTDHNLVANFVENEIRITANQDPDHKQNYYSTFFTSEGAYRVPETAKAYAGTVESGEETDVLKLTDIGNIIHQNEAVILKASTSDIILMPSSNTNSASADNDLVGTDEVKTLGTGDYALSLGQRGVGFYLWEGKEIGANKAYLSLGSVAGAKAFTFQFEDETDAIQNCQLSTVNSQLPTYNLNGMRVNDNYKGIVIKNGKKIYQK